MSAIKINIDRHIGLKIQTKQGQEIHKSGSNAKDIDSFLNYVATAWADYQKRIATPAANWVPVKYMRPAEFVESFSDQANVILFRLTRRQRHNSSQDGERRGRVPASREQITDPEDSENLITLLSQKRENTVEFEVWSTHSKKANQIALQFERFMQAYDWYFTSRGITRVWFEERKEDRVETTGATEWSVRPLVFRVETELIYKEVDRKFNTITVRHDTGSKLKTTVVNAATGLLEHSIDRG